MEKVWESWKNQWSKKTRAKSENSAATEGGESDEMQVQRSEQQVATHEWRVAISKQREANTSKHTVGRQ